MKSGRLLDRLKLIALTLICLLGVSLLFTRPAEAQFVYVLDEAVNNGNRIFGFSVAADGSLTRVPGSPFSTDGRGDGTTISGITSLPGNNRIYSSNSSFESNSVSGFDINPDGSLKPLPGSPFALTPGIGITGGRPAGVTSSPDGQFLFVGRGTAPTGAGTGIEAFEVAADGALALIPGSPFGVGTSGTGADVVFDPIRNHLITTQVSGGRVSVFDVETDGALTSIEGSPFITPTTNNQRMALSPPGDLLFVAGGGPNPLASVMAVDASGALSNAAGSPLNVGFITTGTVVDPTGRFVYFGAAFDGGANIQGFDIGPGGSLTAIATSPFASGGVAPWSLATDIDGQFLFALNAFSASVGVFRIGANGKLDPIGGSPFTFQSSCLPTSCVPPMRGSGPTALVFVGPAPKNINDLVSFVPISSTTRTTDDATGCPAGFSGKFSFDARLTNTSDNSLSSLMVKVATLTNSNLLQNADGGPAGVGATLTVPRTGNFSDGRLGSDEFVDVPFVLCLKERQPFSFFVDVLGLASPNKIAARETLAD